MIGKVLGNENTTKYLDETCVKSNTPYGYAFRVQPMLDRAVVSKQIAR